MGVRKIFITGIGGCVGHYLFDELRNEQLVLLVRDPSRLLFDPKQYPNVTIIQDDMKNIEKHADVVRQADALVHLAADWAGHEGNLDYSLELFQLLDPKQCKKAIYFSTASILGPDNKPVKEAETLGTHYIRGKYQFFQKLKTLPIGPNVITLFPTWVLGGDKAHPYSHAAQGILSMRKWLWLIRFFTVATEFHYIHARDLARIAKYLLDHDVKEKEFVLGNPPTTATQLIKEVCRFYKVPVYFQIPITLGMVKFLAALIGRKLHPWDLYSFKRRNFVFRTVNAQSFGLNMPYKSIAAILESLPLS
jgi:nucleoside-diphosphate-sugar epimerase